MKICAIICEFNPFHNGHAYIIGQAKKLTGCDAVLCIMSGSFTQRGEICRTDKFLRAKHAILNGADAVIELPVSFAVAPAEIFARGAVKILAALPQVMFLAFGCENGSVADFESAADILLNESEEFKSALNAGLDSGESYIRSVSAAFEKCGGTKGLLSSPNNILGVEYAKAVKSIGADIRLVPVKRVGAGYSDGSLADGGLADDSLANGVISDGGLADAYSSAFGIRANADNPAIKKSMPQCSYEDFIRSRDNSERYERFAADWLFKCDKEVLKRVYGCTEGLENRLKNLVFGRSFGEITVAAATKRYSESRIRRILCGNLLGLYSDDTAKFLQCDLTANVLAVKKEKADELLPLLSKPVRKDSGDEICRFITSRSYDYWRYLSAPLIFDNPNQKMILV